MDIDDRRQALIKHALRSQQAQRIQAMVRLAQSEAGIAVKPSDLDADPWLFNCENGTIELKTGILREHRREDLITKLAPVEYHPDARSELWENFLREAMGGDEKLIGFLQRGVGYSLTGDTSEEVLFFINGPAASGKTTFIEAVKATLGDYALTADFETFLARPNVTGSPRSDLARLAGARLVASVEVDEGRRIAQALVKTVTGGDKQVARQLYREEFEFKAQYKLWLAANHAPKVPHHDEALWRRILRVPFEFTVPKERRDPKLKATLTDPAKAGAAILAWAVQGCLAWQLDGLGVPPIIEQATVAYRADMDPLRDFLADCCVLDPGATVLSKALWAAYGEWAKEASERAISRTNFADGLRARGCQDHKGAKGARAWRGIGLLAEIDAGGAGGAGWRGSQELPFNRSHGTSSRNSRHLTPPTPPARPNGGGSWGEV